MEQSSLSSLVMGQADKPEGEEEPEFVQNFTETHGALMKVKSYFLRTHQE